MENIVIVEKLCEKLQESDRPTDLGVAIALRVILDENITIDELRAEAVSNYGRTLKRNSELVVLYHKSEAENSKLKEANNILTVEIEQANVLIKMYKERNVGNSRAVFLKGEVTVIDSITKLQEFLKPVQTSIDFPVTSSPKAVQVNEREKSNYYKKANKRALKIFVECEKNEARFILSTRHIVKWENQFYLKQGNHLTLDHIKLACLPKCHGGLGSLTGMMLEQWAISNASKPKEC